MVGTQWSVVLNRWSAHSVCGMRYAVLSYRQARALHTLHTDYRTPRLASFRRAEQILLARLVGLVGHEGAESILPTAQIEAALMEEHAPQDGR